MGDLADDVVEGLACSDCGVYFEKEHGYPVLCSSCYNDQPSDNPTTMKPLAVEKEL